MKKLMNSVLVLLALCLSVSTFAQNNMESASKQVATAEIEKDIALSEAPEAVQLAIADDKFAGWEAKKVTYIAKGDRVYYKVKFKKGDEKVYHKFNPDGTMKKSKMYKKDKGVKEKS